jgi:hypothetical protein
MTDSGSNATAGLHRPLACRAASYRRGGERHDLVHTSSAFRTDESLFRRNEFVSVIEPAGLPAVVATRRSTHTPRKRDG